MKFHDFYNQFGKLCSNIGLGLEEQRYALILGLLRDYPCTSLGENSFDNILHNSNLENLVQPSELWSSYCVFRRGLAASYGQFCVEKVRENVIPALLYIILSENRLLLGDKYFDEIAEQHPEYRLSVTQTERRRHVASVEYQLASQIEHVKLRLFLNNAYMKTGGTLDQRHLFMIGVQLSYYAALSLAV